MKNEMWKRSLRRGAALVLALVMSLTITSCSASQGSLTARERAREPEYVSKAGGKVHEAVPYSRRPYEHYDPAAMEQAMADFEQACASQGREEEVLRLYDAIVDEYDRLATLTYMAQLNYDRDVSDEQAAAEQAYTTDIYSEMGDKAAACLKKGMNSSYKELLTDKMGIEYAPYIEYYRENSGELTELNRREQELLREYDKLASGDFTVELEGGQWSYSRLEREPDLDDGQYAEIEDALVREKNRVLGSKFRELVQVRRRTAELKGYDNYARYSFEAVYGRDYTLQDAEGLCSDVKTRIVPLNNDIWYMDVAQESYDSLDLMEESSAQDILAGVGRAVGSVNPELGEIFRYMQDNELYDIQSGEDGQDRMDNNYTVGLPSYGDAFIFINRNHTFTDYQSLIHEFGHFSSYYYNSVPELFQGYSVDVCEVQSQGLEMLANQYAGDMFGEGAEAFEFETVTDMLYVIIMSCMLQEFEEAVYMDPDMSLEDMNRTFKEIQDSYHGWYFDVYDEGVCYDWVDVSHLFYSPLYYMGYGTSALSALDLWTMSRRDWDGAVDTYMGLLNEGLDAPYRDTMYRCGLRDVFDSGELEALAGDVRRIQGLDQDGEGAEDPSQENPSQDIPSQEDPDQAGANSEGNSGSGLRAAGFLVLAGICVILVFQVMILCTGFVIIWLLVRKKREE